MKNLKETILRTWHGNKDYERIYGKGEHSPANITNFIKFSSIADLTDALIRAKDAHTQFERSHGPDANWPLWYAAFLALEQGMGIESPVCKSKKCVSPSEVTQTTEPKWIKEWAADEEEYWKAHS